MIDFSVRTLGMLLLHVGVQRGIGKISLVAVLALVISALDVVLGPSFGLCFIFVI